MDRIVHPGERLRCGRRASAVLAALARAGEGRQTGAAAAPYISDKDAQKTQIAGGTKASARYRRLAMAEDDATQASAIGAQAVGPQAANEGATPTVTVYSKPDCHLCEQAMAVLGRLRLELSFTLRELDITAEEALHRAYFERIPVVALDGEELCEHHVSEALLRERLESRR